MKYDAIGRVDMENVRRQVEEFARQSSMQLIPAKRGYTLEDFSGKVVAVLQSDGFEVKLPSRDLEYRIQQAYSNSTG
jgi:hypothetical protein